MDLKDWLEGRVRHSEWLCSTELKLSLAYMRKIPRVFVWWVGELKFMNNIYPFFRITTSFAAPLKPQTMD